MFGPLAVNWNFNRGLATDILYTLELLYKNSVVLNNKHIQRKLLSHSWLDTKQQQQQRQHPSHFGTDLFRSFGCDL